jgi:hypothetical protein
LSNTSLFLTSSSWLATRYGKRLKQLLLNDYDVLWLAETNADELSLRRPRADVI